MSYCVYTGSNGGNMAAAQLQVNMSSLYADYAKRRQDNSYLLHCLSANMHVIYNIVQVKLFKESNLFAAVIIATRVGHIKCL